MEELPHKMKNSDEAAKLSIEIEQFKSNLKTIKAQPEKFLMLSSIICLSYVTKDCSPKILELWQSSCIFFEDKSQWKQLHSTYTKVLENNNEKQHNETMQILVSKLNECY